MIVAQCSAQPVDKRGVNRLGDVTSVASACGPQLRNQGTALRHAVNVATWGIGPSAILSRVRSEEIWAVQISAFANQRPKETSIVCQLHAAEKPASLRSSLAFVTVRLCGQNWWTSGEDVQE